MRDEVSLNEFSTIRRGSYGLVVFPMQTRDEEGPGLVSVPFYGLYHEDAAVANGITIIPNEDATEVTLGMIRDPLPDGEYAVVLVDPEDDKSRVFIPYDILKDPEEFQDYEVGCTPEMGDWLSEHCR